jgi:hypothetical protein
MPSQPTPKRNILNPQDAQEWLSALADDRLAGIAEDRAAKTRQWLLAVGRKWILREGATTPVDASASELPEWALKALQEGEPVDRLLLTDRERERLALVVDWLRAADGPSTRTDWTRIGFDQAEKSEKQWTIDHNRAAERDLAAKKDQDIDAQGISLALDLDGGWRWVKVTSADSLNREGVLMRHCVGSYAGLVAAGGVEIWSLRDPENQPHLTIETRDSSVRQLKGFANTQMREDFAKQTALFLRHFEAQQKLTANLSGQEPSPDALAADLSINNFFRLGDGELRHGTELTDGERAEFIRGIDGDPKIREKWGIASFSLNQVRARAEIEINETIAIEAAEARNPALFGFSMDDWSRAPQLEPTHRPNAEAFSTTVAEEQLIVKMRDLARLVMIGADSGSQAARAQQDRIDAYLQDANGSAALALFVRLEERTLKHISELTSDDRASYGQALGGDLSARSFWSLTDPNGPEFKALSLREQRERTTKSTLLSRVMARSSAKDSFSVSETLRDQILDFFAPGESDSRMPFVLDRQWFSGILEQKNEDLAIAAIERVNVRLAHDPERAAQLITASAASAIGQGVSFGPAVFQRLAQRSIALKPCSLTPASLSVFCVISSAVAAHRFDMALPAIDSGSLPIWLDCVPQALAHGDSQARQFAAHAIASLAALWNGHADAENRPKFSANERSSLAEAVGAWAAKRPKSDTAALSFFAPLAPFASDAFWATEAGQEISRRGPPPAHQADGVTPNRAPKAQNLAEWRAAQTTSSASPADLKKGSASPI